MRIASVQKKYAEGVAIGRRLWPVAEGVDPQAHLDDRMRHAMTSYYTLFARAMRHAHVGTAQERIELNRRALQHGQRRALDSGDIGAILEVSNIESEMAEDYETVDSEEAGRLYSQAVEARLQRPETIENVLSARIGLYSTAERALRFFARRGRPAQAVALAQRTSGVMSPAMFLKLNLPRSKEAQRIQALWWTASIADDEKTRSSAWLWKEAIAAAEEGLRQSPSDAVIEASAALAFDGQADWLRTSGQPGEIWRGKAHELWTRLSAAFPDNEFIRNRAAGGRNQHGNN